MCVVNFAASIGGFVDYGGGGILREIKRIVLHGPKVQQTSLTEVLMGGGVDGVLRGLEEGWAEVSVHQPDSHMWISEGLVSDATGVMIYDTM